LKKDEILLDREAAEHVSAIIRVPKPTLIRLYRGCEPETDVFGETSHEVAYSVPKTHHDVLVFSYLDFHREKVSLGEIADAQLTDSLPVRPVTWIIYSTDKVDRSKENKHKTANLNDLLRTRGGEHTKFDLSVVAANDGAPDTVIGLHPEHLAAVRDLPPDVTKGNFSVGCGAMSCTGIIRG
jgi:hypothetical protein